MKWLLLFLPLSIAAYEGYLPTQEAIKPWFTGPLLAGAGNTTRPGHWNIEPYMLAIARTSFYNENWKSQPIETLWNLQYRLPVWAGITDRIDFRIVAVWNWNERKGQSDWTLGDWSAQINFQIHRDQLPHKSWLPSIKLSVREVFPTGKYRNLNPKKLGTDSNGMGSWTTFAAINMSKVFALHDTHFLNLYLNFIGAFPTNVRVKGFNAYGGGYGTKGTVYPENAFQMIFAFEYSLSRNWVLACDVTGIWTGKTRFSGQGGHLPSNDSSIDPEGLPAVNENRAAIQYSLAPAIEYNWSENLGLIAGVWFTIAGKNSSHFTSGAIALNYSH